MPDLDDLTLRRSSRSRKPSHNAEESNSTTVRRMFSLFTCFTAMALEVCAGVSGDSLSISEGSSLQRLVLHTERVNSHFDGTVNRIHHAVLMTEADSNDVYTMREVMKQDDFPCFIEAMVKEVSDHESRDHWSLVPRSEMPPGTKTILAI